MEEFRRYERRLKGLFKPKKLFPIINWLPKYELSFIGPDIICGLTLGFMVIPQSFAYAQLASLPAQYGLYTSYIGLLFYIFMGSALHINIGTAAVMSLLTGNFILQASSNLPAPYANSVYTLPFFASMLSFWNGIIVLLMGLLGLGLIVNFFSIPVNVGYTSACTVIITASQLAPLFGVATTERDTIPRIKYAVLNAYRTNFWDLSIGLIGIFWILLVEFGAAALVGRILRRMKSGTKAYENFDKGANIFIACRNFIWMVCATAFAYVMINSHGKNITVIKNIPPGVNFKVPAFSIYTQGGGNVTGNDSSAPVLIASTADMMSDMSIGIILMPIITMVSQFAIGRSLGRRAGYRMDASQELITLGVINVVGSFFGAYPTSGSITRSALVFQTKPKSLLYNALQAFMVLMSLYFLTGIFQWTPKAALASMIVCSLLEMVEYKMWIKIIRRTPFELVPLLVTFASSIALSVDYGIIIGLGVSAILYLLPITHFPFFISYEDMTGGQAAIIMTMRQTFKYVSVDRFISKVSTMVRREKHPLIIDCTFVTAIDFTGLEGLHNLLQDIHKTGHTLVFVSLRPSLLKRIENFGVEYFTHYETMEEALIQLPIILRHGDTATMQFESFPPPLVDTSDARIMQDASVGYGLLDQGYNFQDEDEIVLNSYRRTSMGRGRENSEPALQKTMMLKTDDLKDPADPKGGEFHHKSTPSCSSI